MIYDWASEDPETDEQAYLTWLEAVFEYEQALARIPLWQRLLGKRPIHPEGWYR